MYSRGNGYRAAFEALILLIAATEPRKIDDLDELARKNRELFERSKNRKQDFKIVESEIIQTVPDPLPPPPLKERETTASRISTATSNTAVHNQTDRSGYATDVSSATWQYNSNSFSPRSVVSINGGQQDGLLKIRTSQSVANITEVETKPWPHMPANLRPVADSPQSTMTREMNENYARRIERYNSMPVLETSNETATRGTLIRLQDEKPRSIMKVRESSEMVVSKPKTTETVHRIEERKRTEEIERRVLRRERRHKSHRSRYSHGQQQEAIGWQGGGGSVGSSPEYQTSTLTRTMDEEYHYKRTTSIPAYHRRRELSETPAHRVEYTTFPPHRSSSMSRGGYNDYYAGGNHYPTYNGGNYNSGYNAGYNAGYNGHYNGGGYNQYYNNHNGYDFPPAFPRRTASATIYH